jgi:hypothetical protein
LIEPLLGLNSFPSVSSMPSFSLPWLQYMQQTYFADWALQHLLKLEDLGLELGNFVEHY